MPSKRSNFTGLSVTGGAACWAELCTLPFDTAKVKSHLSTERVSATVKKPSLLQSIRVIVQTDGLKGLFRAAPAGFQRQLAFAPVKIMIYTPIRNLVASIMGREAHEANPFDMALAGGLTGSTAMAIAQPTDVIKIRIQKGEFNTVREAWAGIFQKNGIRGFYSGMSANLLRNTAVTMGELVTYDLTKRFLRSCGYEESMAVHGFAAMLAGGVAATMCSPFDVIKSRMSADPSIKSMRECFNQVRKEKGYRRGFYAGYGASVIRIAAWNVIFFISMEEGRHLLGMDAVAK